MAFLLLQPHIGTHMTLKDWEECWTGAVPSFQFLINSLGEQVNILNGSLDQKSEINLLPHAEVIFGFRTVSPSDLAGQAKKDVTSWKVRDSSNPSVTCLQSQDRYHPHTAWSLSRSQQLNHFLIRPGNILQGLAAYMWILRVKFFEPDQEITKCF